jgi:hypothetical protein
MSKRIILSVCILLAIQNINQAQKISIEGKVLSAENRHEPLAFVKITVLKAKLNKISDIDGNWKFTNVFLSDTLEFSYLGYITKKIPVSSFNVHQKEQLVYLDEKAQVMDEITIRPTANPADRIIKEVLLHKEQNNYNNLKSFAFYSYTNMHAKIIPLDSSDNSQSNLPALSNRSKSDHPKKNGENSIDSFSDKQYLFLIETVESIYYHAPEKFKKNVLAYHVSGVNDERMVFFATAFEKFNIYQNFIELGEKNYASPIANRTLNNYLFTIKDTIWTPEKDTVFVIAYQPHKHTYVNGFKGVLYINSRNYAVQNIIATPVYDTKGPALKIHQQFDYINNKQWFPVQQDIEIDFAKLSSEDNHIIAFEGKSYYQNINLDTLIPDKEFSDVESEVKEDAGKKDSMYWQTYRGRPLNEKERITYKMIDSFARMIKLDKTIQIMDAVFSRRIPVGAVDIDLDKIFILNNYEGYRLGAGLYTNDKISRYFSIGGYYGYGFKDKASKYGASLEIKPKPASFFSFGIDYSKDVYEFGGTKFSLEGRTAIGEAIRELSINDMYTSVNKHGYVKFRLPIHLQMQLSFQQSLIHTNDTYQFISPDHIPGSDYQITEAQACLRYAYKETIIKTSKYQMTNTYEKGPVILFQYTRGLKNAANGMFNYDKYDLKINKRFFIPLLGSANFQVSSGFISGTPPLFKEFNAPANYLPEFSLASQNCFEVMKPNEFFNSWFTYLFYNQSIAWMPIKTKLSVPALSLRQNIGFGQINNPGSSTGIAFKDMHNGYFESGIQVDNILVSSFSGLGIGFFYRYGSYSTAAFKNNFAIKLTISSYLLQ